MCVYSIDEIKTRITPIAEKYNLSTVYIFGSYARGEATEDSDVDLLIDASNVHGIEIGGVYEDLQLALNKSIDMITTRTLTQERTLERSGCFVQQVNKEKMKLYG